MTEPGRGRSQAILWVIAAAVLVILVTAAVLGTTGGPDRRPTGSPEATVQAYFEALRDDRRGDLEATFTDELAERCTLGPQTFLPDVSRVATSGTTVDGDRAEVRVSVTERFGSGLLDSSENTIDETVVLVRIDDEWRIAESPWPYLCGFGGKP